MERPKVSAFACMREVTNRRLSRVQVARPYRHPCGHSPERRQGGDNTGGDDTGTWPASPLGCGPSSSHIATGFS
eukprot:6000321-Pyramimonas_sp.AAC.1